MSYANEMTPYLFVRAKIPKVVYIETPVQE